MIHERSFTSSLAVRDGGDDRTLTIEDRSDAAWGEWLVSDALIGREVLALARDGVPLGLSVGFMEVPGGSRWSADRQRVTRTRAALDHVAVVRVPAYQGAGVVGVRDLVRGHPPRSSSPSGGHEAGKASWTYRAKKDQHLCVICRTEFRGPGDRCQRHRQQLAERRRRKPR